MRASTGQFCLDSYRPQGLKENIGGEELPVSLSSYNRPSLPEQVLPQILLLLREKRAQTNSLFLTGGSFALQLLLFIQAVLRFNWPSAFVMGMSVLGNAIIAVLIIYYRRFPNGRKS